MSKRYTAVHEAGHAFIWLYAGTPLEKIWIAASPAMGVDEWEEETDPGDVADIDLMYTIMSAYAGALAEAKIRIQDSLKSCVTFDLSNDEQAFVDSRITDPSPSGGRTRISFEHSVTKIKHIQLLLTASFNGDTKGTSSEKGAYVLATEVGRLDVLVPLCRDTRTLLDLPASWNSILRFAGELEKSNKIVAPNFKAIFARIFEEETAFAAWFLVDASARGVGLGRYLLTEAISFCKNSGFQSVFLWTVSALTTAARLYCDVGFRKTEEIPSRQWGVDVIEEKYVLRLNDRPTNKVE